MTGADDMREAQICFDTEFIEDGSTIELLSIGLVRADGATYYAEPAETDRTRASDWVAENVLPGLTGPVKPRAQIAAEIVEFVGPNPEFWAWYADYDWVALCQLYGTMMDLPDGWPMYCRDFKQVADERGVSIAQGDSRHNALGDAQWLADAMATSPPVVAAVVAEKTAEIERLTREVEVKYLNAIGFKNERDAARAELAEKDAKVERLREYIEGWKGENALIARQRDAQVEKTIRAWSQRDQALGVVAAVKALVDEWEREWEYLGRVGHAAVPAARLRAVLGPVSGAADGAGEAVDHRAWVCARCGEAPEMHAGANSRCIYDPILRATPVAEHEQEVRADAWDKGARAAGGYGHEDDWTHDANPLLDNPYRAARTPEAGS